MTWKDQEDEAIRKLESWSKPLHERGERARAEKRQMDPDGSLKRGDWWAIALLPGPLIKIYAAAVERKARKAGL